MKRWFNQEHNCDCLCNLYEAKVHPLLRFLHQKNIKSCGWVKIISSEGMIVSEEDKYFNVDLELNNVPVQNILPLEQDTIAKFVTASFDIECDSSHGDFPNPIKDFRKVAIDIYESYFRTSQNLNNFSMKKLFIRKCIEDSFNCGSNDVQNIYTINNANTKYILFYVAWLY